MAFRVIVGDREKKRENGRSWLGFCEPSLDTGKHSTSAPILMIRPHLLGHNYMKDSLGHVAAAGSEYLLCIMKEDLKSLVEGSAIVHILQNN
jgi:hypothetical protein